MVSSVVGSMLMVTIVTIAGTSMVAATVYNNDQQWARMKYNNEQQNYQMRSYWENFSFEFDSQANNRPTINNCYPSDNSINVELNPTLRVDVNDDDGENNMVTFYEHDPYGSIQPLMIYQEYGIANRTVFCATEMDTPNHMFYWSAVVTDSYNRVTTGVLSFTTTPLIP